MCVAAKRKKITLAASKRTCSTAPVAEVRSPCTGVCRIDEVSGHCLGCRRTIDEIVDWPRLPPQGKRAVLAKLAGRAVPPFAS